jgi:hypothetical protein
MTTDPLPFTIEESIDGMKIHIQGKNRWGLFSLMALPLILITLFVIAFTIAFVAYCFYGIGLFIFGGQTDPETGKILLAAPLVLIVLVGVGIGLYGRWCQALALIPGHETLEFDAHGLTIKRTNLIHITRHIPAGEILGICHSGLFLRGFLAGSSNLASLFKNNLWVWRNGKYHYLPISICLYMDSADANPILSRIHARYPAYR